MFYLPLVMWVRMTLNIRMVSEELIGKDVEGSSCGQICDTVSTCV